MKKVLFAISAFALLMGAASCQEEDFGKVDNNSNVENPLNTITVKIGGANTRLGLDGLTPCFEEGDEVFGWDATGNYTYQCTSVSGSDAVFTRTSTYAPSADEGTKVNLVFANGFSATDITDGTLSIDITKQDASSFEDLPIVMTASGSVDASGKCTMTFTNETSVIMVDNCTSGASAGRKLTPSVDNLYPKMTLTIGTDGAFEKVVDDTPATITNKATSLVDENKAFSFCLATFPTPSGNGAKQVYISVMSDTDWPYSCAVGEKTIPANTIIKISGKNLPNEYAQLAETGDRFGSIADAFAAANDYSGACTVKLSHTTSNSTPISVTNPHGVTLDLDGKTLTVKSTNRITPSESGKLIIDGNGSIVNSTEASNVFNISSGTLILKKATIGFASDATTATNPTAGVYVQGTAKFEMQGGKINVSSGASALIGQGDSKITISDGTISSSSVALSVAGSSQTTITGGTITTTATGLGNGALLVNSSTASVTINGENAKVTAPNTASGNASCPAACLKSGSLILKNGSIGAGYTGLRMFDGSFIMEGGDLYGKRHAIIFAYNAEGSGTATIKGGEVRNTLDNFKLLRFESTSKNTLNIEGGYIYAYGTSVTFSDIPAAASCNVSGGYYNKDINSYAGVNFNGKSCVALDPTVTYNSRTYTHEVK